MKKSSHQIIWVFLAVLMELSALGMMIPVIPYMARNYGASALQVGLLMSIYSAVQCLVSPFWGRWSDRAGRRPVLLLSMLCTSLSYLWFYFSPSLLHLFLSRAFAGAVGVSVSSSFAFISDLTEKKGRSKNMALVGAAFGLGFVIGPLLGGVLASYSQEEVALGASIVCLFGLLIGLFKIRESYTKISEKQESSYLHRFSIALKDPSLRKLLSLFFVLSIGLTLVEAPLFLLMKDQFNWPQSFSSLGFAYIGFILALTQGFFVRSWIPLFGEKKVNLWGLFLLAFGLFGLCIPDLRGVAFAVTLLALGFGCSYTCLTGMISLLTKKTHQGGVLGIHQSVSSISRILGPALGGWIYGKWGFQILFLFAGAVAAVGFVLSLFFRKSLQDTSSQNKDSSLEDYGALTGFQLDNLIKNQVPFSLFYLSEKESQTNVLPAPAQNLLKLSQSIKEEDLLKRSLGDHPVVLICEDGRLSQKLSLKLLEKWTNVFYLEGGLLKYQENTL